MRYLVISDLHSSEEALAAVFQAADGEYDSVLCCGDLVGYGPSPNEVIERLQEAKATVIRGNHDRTACGLDDPDWFGESARQAILWTRATLSPAHHAYLRNLSVGPLPLPDGSVQLVHGSLLDEDEYVYEGAAAYDSLSLTSLQVTFFGHTHLPCVFSLTPDDDLRLEAAGEATQQTSAWFHLEKDVRYLINPGSVGQPRDGDPRASFALYDSKSHFVKLRRVEYDIESVQEKMRRVHLPEFLIDRLAVGE